MGLDDLEPDEEETGSGQRRYTTITRSAFREYLDGRDEQWEVLSHPSKEVVYRSVGAIPLDNVAVVIFSTVDVRDNKSRDKGADAIRTVLWHTETESLLAGRRKTLRIDTWKKNLGEKIDSLLESYKNAVTFCDECGSVMVEQDGPYGEFLGCSTYPDCNYTEQIE